MIRLVRRVVATPFRWAALGLLADTRVSNRIAHGLLVAWAWVRGFDAPEIPATRPAEET